MEIVETQCATPGAPAGEHADEPLESSKRELYILRAKAALASAGRALEVNGSSGQDIPLAAICLARAFETIASTFVATEARGTPEEIVELLDDTVLKATIGNRRRARALAQAISRPELARSGDVLRAELFVAKLIERAVGRRKLRRAELRVTVAIYVVLIALGSLLAAKTYVYFTSSDRLRFRASSNGWGFPRTGKVGHRGDYDLFFHTQEEDHPWVEIDLGGHRKVTRVTIENRHDCGGDRAIPLVVELRDDAGKYHEVARQTDVFDTWTAEFPSQDATAVKLLVPRVTTLHLTDVQIR